MNALIIQEYVDSSGRPKFAVTQEDYWTEALKLKEIMNTINTPKRSQLSPSFKGVIGPYGQVIYFTLMHNL
jgi:hypothetical protein